MMTVFLACASTKGVCVEHILWTYLVETRNGETSDRRVAYEEETFEISK